MTSTDYQNLVDTYGVHPSRWPEDMRVEAMCYAENNPDLVAELNAEAGFLDKILDVASLPTASLPTTNLPATNLDLLSARILKSAKNTPQDTQQNIGPQISTPANDHPTRFLADDTPQKPFAKWKTLAATLLITTGIGFSLGQNALARSDYRAAETLYAFSMDTEYGISEASYTYEDSYNEQ